MHHAANCISSNPNTRGHVYVYGHVIPKSAQITQKMVVVKLKFLFHSRRYEAPYFSCRAVIQLVHLFSYTFETALYNMIIHVIVFLVFYVLSLALYVMLLLQYMITESHNIMFVPHHEIHEYPYTVYHIPYLIHHFNDSNYIISFPLICDYQIHYIICIKLFITSLCAQFSLSDEEHFTFGKLALSLSINSHYASQYHRGGGYNANSTSRSRTRAISK